MRLRTDNVPGVVLHHVPASEKVYIGSPSLAVLPDGRYVASHDHFGPGSTYNQTYVYASKDRGATWALLAKLHGQFWSGLFVHNGALYLMGTIGQSKSAGIRRSDDGGATWTEPTSPRWGLLIEGDHHTAPVPVVLHEGRLWRAMEDRDPPGGGSEENRSFVMSAPVDADLLDARSWRSSTRVCYPSDAPGWCWREGNVVVAPDGQMWIILRNDTQARNDTEPHGTGGLAVRVKVCDEGRRAEIDPKTAFFDFPGGNKKFTIRRDPQTGLYWSLTNWVHPDDVGGNVERTRNTLALTASPDLFTWSVRAVLLRHPDVANVGFQYVDWQFEGEDIIAAIRTAHPDGLGGAHHCHDANFLTFHRFEGFRALGQ